MQVSHVVVYTTVYIQAFPMAGFEITVDHCGNHSFQNQLDTYTLARTLNHSLRIRTVNRLFKLKTVYFN